MPVRWDAWQKCANLVNSMNGSAFESSSASGLKATLVTSPSGIGRASARSRVRFAASISTTPVLHPNARIIPSWLNATPATASSGIGSSLPRLRVRFVASNSTTPFVDGAGDTSPYADDGFRGSFSSVFHISGSGIPRLPRPARAAVRCGRLTGRREGPIVRQLGDVSALCKQCRRARDEADHRPVLFSKMPHICRAFPSDGEYARTWQIC
jgi:hypothetical protein